jgi:hypothetical protein
MNSAVRAAWFVVLGALGMLAVLLTIVYRGSRTIESQKASLKTSFKNKYTFAAKMISSRRRCGKRQTKPRELMIQYTEELEPSFMMYRRNS